MLENVKTVGITVNVLMFKEMEIILCVWSGRPNPSTDTFRFS